MIKGINSNSRHIVVTGGSSSAPYINATNLGAGQLRYNPGMQTFEVYDGIVWHQMQGAYTAIDLSEDSKQILAWAAEKMRKEEELEALCAKYPGLAKARDNYELFKQFVDAQEKVNSEVEET
jgi:hypothetical protein